MPSQTPGKPRNYPWRHPSLIVFLIPAVALVPATLNAFGRPLVALARNTVAGPASERPFNAAMAAVVLCVVGICAALDLALVQALILPGWRRPGCGFTVADDAVTVYAPGERRTIPLDRLVGIAPVARHDDRPTPWWRLRAGPVATVWEIPGDDPLVVPRAHLQHNEIVQDIVTRCQRRASSPT